MKPLIAATGLILIAFLLVMNALTPTIDTSPSVSAQTAQTVESTYRISSSGGRVAVYRDGTLYRRTDTLLSSLPKADRRKVEEGITVYSEKELKRVLQDYCS